MWNWIQNEPPISKDTFYNYDVPRFYQLWASGMCLIKPSIPIQWPSNHHSVAILAIGTFDPLSLHCYNVHPMWRTLPLSIETLYTDYSPLPCLLLCHCWRLLISRIIIKIKARGTGIDRCLRFNGTCHSSCIDTKYVQVYSQVRQGKALYSRLAVRY